MKNIALILSVLTALCCAVDIQKLQIVVENNVEDCEYRAQNGDLVYTYYTVSIELIEIICDQNTHS